MFIESRRAIVIGRFLSPANEEIKKKKQYYDNQHAAAADCTIYYTVNCLLFNQCVLYVYNVHHNQTRCKIVHFTPPRPPRPVNSTSHRLTATTITTTRPIGII